MKRAYIRGLLLGACKKETEREWKGEEKIDAFICKKKKKKWNEKRVEGEREKGQKISLYENSLKFTVKIRFSV